jgi:glucokinase
MCRGGIYLAGNPHARVFGLFAASVARDDMKQKGDAGAR